MIFVYLQTFVQVFVHLFLMYLLHRLQVCVPCVFGFLFALGMSC